MRHRKAFIEMMHKPEAREGLDKVYKYVLTCLACHNVYGTDNQCEISGICPICIHQLEVVEKHKKEEAKLR